MSKNLRAEQLLGRALYLTNFMLKGINENEPKKRGLLKSQGSTRAQADLGHINTSYPDEAA